MEFLCQQSMVNLNVYQYGPPPPDIKRFSPYSESSSCLVQARVGEIKRLSILKQYNNCLVGICHAHFRDIFGWEISHLATLLFSGKVL